MKLHILGSSSAGNSYVLQNEDAALILECGVPLKKVQKVVGGMAKISGALITHEHLDHSKYVDQYLSRGIRVYSGAGTIEAMTERLKHKYWRFAFRECYDRKQIILPGGFKIVPFKVEHDTAEPYGFFIGHPETGNTLFVTDTHMMNFDFAKVNNMIIEANHCENILFNRTVAGEESPQLRNRIRKSHMSIQELQRFLARTDMSAVNNIVLIHLSDRNSDSILFRKIITNQTGKNVHIADKDMVIDINKEPF